MHRFPHALALAGVFALALAACGSSKDTGLPAGPTTPPAGSVCSGTVDMTDALRFAPEKCTIKVNATVVWKNVGGVPHTVTAEDPKGFNSGDVSHPIAGGGQFKFTFSKAGEYPYFCAVHTTRGARTGMVGTIVVQAA